MRGRIVRLLPVLLLGVAAAQSPARAATPFVPLAEATVVRVCPRCDARPQAPRTDRWMPACTFAACAARAPLALSSRSDPPAPLLMPAPYTPLAPARWVGTPDGPGPFPPKPPALS